MKYLLNVNSQYLQKLGSERTTANPLEAETFRDRKSALLAAAAYQAQYSTECSRGPSVVPLDRALARYISRVRLPGRGLQIRHEYGSTVIYVYTSTPDDLIARRIEVTGIPLLTQFRVLASEMLPSGRIVETIVERSERCLAANYTEVFG